MGSMQEAVREYRRQLGKGAIQQAYRGLMDYMMNLRTQLANKHPDYVVSGSIYAGYMDMTYFSFSPPSLSERKLKVAIVFVHEACRFEAWLAGANKQVQGRYWKLIRDSGWNRYRLVPTTQGADSIIETVLVEEPDFNDPDGLTRCIEQGTLAFIRDVEGFLAKKA